MPVIMMVRIDADGVEVAAVAEHMAEGGIAGDRFRAAVAADVAVQAQNVVARRHHQMQIVADHQHGRARAALPVANGLVIVAKRDRVDARRRFVQHDKVGLAQHRPRQKQALRFAAGKCLQRRIKQVGDVQPRKPRAFCRLRDVAQEAARGHRQVGGRVEFLRDKAHFQPFGAGNGAAGRAFMPQYQREQGAFARAVRADNGEDLVTPDGKSDVV